MPTAICLSRKSVFRLYWLRMPYLLAGLFVVALAVTQAFYGGAMRPVFALPGYALVGVCGLLGLSALWRRNASLPGFAQVLSVLAFGGWLIWRTTASPDAWLASGYTRLILACLVVYLIFAFVLTNPIHRLVFVAGLFGLAVIQVGTEAWQLSGPHESFPLPWFSTQLKMWYGPRFEAKAHGFYLNGNHLAWFLNATGLFALSATCWGRWGIKTKVVTLYVALMSFAGSVLTASRGGATSLAAGLAAFLILSGALMLLGRRNGRHMAFILPAICLLASVVTATCVIQSSYLVQARFSHFLDETYRPSLLAVAAREFQLDPMYGGGAGAFSFYACQFRTMNDTADDVYAHNDWAQLLADFGLPAGCLLALALVIHLIGGLRNMLAILRVRMTPSGRPQSHAIALLVAALSSLAVFVVESGFDFNMHIPVNALLASACLGLLANSGVTAIDKERPKGGVMARVLGCFLAALGGGFLLYLTAQAARPEIFWLRAENAFLTGKPREAEEFVNEGLTKNLVHPPFCRLAGLVDLEIRRLSDSPWDRLQRGKDAIQLFARAAADSPQDWKNSFMLGRSLKEMGRMRLAEASTIDSIRLNLTQAFGYDLYGDCLATEGRLGEILDVLRRAVFLPGAAHSWPSITEVERRQKALLQSNGKK